MCVYAVCMQVCACAAGSGYLTFANTEVAREGVAIWLCIFLHVCSILVIILISGRDSCMVGEGADRQWRGSPWLLGLEGETDPGREEGEAGGTESQLGR